MKTHHKLPFNIKLERKYNEINIDEFLNDWIEFKPNRQKRVIQLDNELHIEIGKFKTFNISMNEFFDLALRYALSKQEFRKLTVDIINEKIKKD